MLCARVVRGAASSAKPVSSAAARRCRPGASNGLSMPTTVVPGFISAELAAERTAHLEHQVAAKGAGAHR